MKLIIAGGRNYRCSMDDLARLHVIRTSHEITELVTRGAPGAESFGDTWAEQHGIPVKRFGAATTNRVIADYAAAVALFPGRFHSAVRRNC